MPSRDPDVVLYSSTFSYVERSIFYVGCFRAADDSTTTTVSRGEGSGKVLTISVALAA